MTRRKGFCWFVATVVVITAMWGVATDALACGGGPNPEPGGNTPTGYKLEGPAITGSMHLYGEVGPDISGDYTTTFDFDGRCKGKSISFQVVENKNKKQLSEFQRNCETSVEDCINNGGYIETQMIPVDENNYPLLANANCDDAVMRHSEVGIYMFVQAVPAFRYSGSTNELFADVVILFLIPEAVQ